MESWKPLGLRHDDRAEEGREAVELPGCSRQRLHQCGKAAVFIDVNGEASCVPRAGLIKSKQHQSDRALAAPAFALDAAFCLSCCTTIVRRTNIEQAANFASGTGLRQTGALPVAY
jgi:hypothetical protein